MRNTYTADDNIVYTMLITDHSQQVYIISHLLVAEPTDHFTLTEQQHQISSSWGHRGEPSKIDGIEYEFHILMC